MYPSRGVTMPANQGSPRGEGPSQTVVNVSPCTFVAVEYFDSEGRRVRDVFMKMGDEYYAPKNSVEWTRDLGVVRPWLRDSINRKLPVPDGAVKISDSVDVLTPAAAG